MVNNRRPEKNRTHWNNVSIKGFVFIVIVLICAPVTSYADPTDTEANNTITINCSGLKTCKKCTEQESCLWSLERQTCFTDYGTPLLLTVRTETECPCILVISTVTYASDLPYVYAVKVSNDVTGFMEFLEQTRVSCVTLDVTRPAKVFGDVISCAPVNRSDLGFDQQTLMTYHCYVIFGEGDTILRLDDGTHSYFTVYDEYHNGYRPDESCVTCLWDVGHFAYYYKWCSSKNLVTGRYRFFVGYSDTDHKAVMPVSDHLSATVPASSNCNDVRIQSVEPLSALWTGGQQVKFTVNNHLILADSVNEVVTVTVAGRDCVRPTIVDRKNSQVTCLLTAPHHGVVRPQADVQGPVLITYQLSSLTVESAQTFRFVYPEITDISPLCGPLTGGTLLTVRGRHLDAGSLVTIVMAVGNGIPSSVPCEVIARHNNRILCLTGPSNKPAAGTINVVFDKILSVQDGTNGPLMFIYTTGPVLAAGQQFGGIASGGTIVPVRGTGFACVSDATMYVDRDGIRRVAIGHCHLVNDTYMDCSTPKLDGPKAGALPERLSFGFHVWHAYGHVSDMPPSPDTDGYMAHPDPVLTDFFVVPASRSVLINGLNLGRGYRTTDVVVVQFSKNLTEAACNVTSITSSHIICDSESPARLNRAPFLVVTIGDQLDYTVNRRTNINQPKSFGFLFVIWILVSITLMFCYYKLKSMNIAHLANTI